MKRHIALFSFLFLFGCAKQDESAQSKQHGHTIEIKAKNITDRPLYAVCFAYMKQKHAPRWQWHKTPVATLEPNTITPITVGHIAKKAYYNSTYGVLGLFKTKQEADNSIYELTPDENKLDLDKLHKLENKTIVIGLEKYGIIGDIFDYSFFPDDMNIPDVPELDFKVENHTGKTIHVCAFIYQKKENMPVWRYDKSPVVQIEPNQEATIDVDTLTNPYDRKYMRGYLAVFDEGEEQLAHNATFQLLKAEQKLNIGLLAALRDRKVVLKNQKYGILGNLIDFTVKQPRKIAFSKHENIRNQPRYRS